MKSFKPREPKYLIYGSHFSATEITYKVSQNINKNVKSLFLQEEDVISQSYFMYRV